MLARAGSAVRLSDAKAGACAADLAEIKSRLQDLSTRTGCHLIADAQEGCTFYCVGLDVFGAAVGSRIRAQSSPT